MTYNNARRTPHLLPPALPHIIVGRSHKTNVTELRANHRVRSRTCRILLPCQHAILCTLRIMRTSRITYLSDAVVLPRACRASPYCTVRIAAPLIWTAGHLDANVERLF